MENTTVTSNQISLDIEQLAEAFIDTFKRGDARGLAAIYAESGMILPPNGDMISGRQQIESFWQGMMNMGVKNVKLQILEVEQHGDTAIELGRATIMDEGNQVLDEVKYIVIWKQENGAWKIYRDIFNSNTKA